MTTTSSYSTSEIRAILLRQEKPLLNRLHHFDVRVTHWLAHHSLTLLRLLTGMVFLWLGALKLSPGLSPTEPLVRAAFPFLASEGVMPALAIWEMLIGLGFIVGRFKRAVIALLALHMMGALLVIALRSDLIFRNFPFALTMEGQYLLMSLIGFGAGLVIAATARGGGLTAEQDALCKAREVEHKVH